MKKLVIFIFILSTAVVYTQNKEVESYKNAMETKEPILKIEALKNFTIEFPNSNYSPRAYFDYCT